MTCRFLAIPALCAALVLSACGSEKANPLPAHLFSSLKALMTKGGATAAPVTAQVLRARLTPELKAQIGRPVLITELPKLKTAALVVEGARNGQHISWFAGDGVGLTTRNGMVTATRGLGFDLMSADVSGPLAAVTGRSGSQSATRVHHYLDGENQEIIQSFTCRYQRQAGQVTERCDAAGLSIENQYFLDRNGRIRNSRQWVGDRNGYIVIETP